MAVWRLITSDPNPPTAPREALNWYLQHHIIALGWGMVGDLRHLPVYQRDDIIPLVQAVYGNAKGNAAGCLWDFWQEIQVHDLVILGLGSTEGGFRACVARVTSDYFWDTNIPHGVPAYFNDYSHRRNIELTNQNPENLWNNTRLAPGYSHLPALNLRVTI